MFRHPKGLPLCLKDYPNCWVECCEDEKGERLMLDDEHVEK